MIKENHLDSIKIHADRHTTKVCVIITTMIETGCEENIINVLKIIIKVYIKNILGFSLFKILTLEVKDGLYLPWSFHNHLIFSLQD